MKFQFTGILILVFAIEIAMLSSCKTETVTTVNEYITTVKVITQRIDSPSTQKDTFQYVNFNEAQNIPPSMVDTIKLQAKAIYAIQVLLLNEATNPVQYLTDTITGRADNHLMIYGVDPASGFLAIKINDKDSKGLPLGLMSNWTTNDKGFGLLRMLLRHQQGSKNGTQTPGSNDFEADFPVLVR